MLALPPQAFILESGTDPLNSFDGFHTWRESTDPTFSISLDHYSSEIGGLLRAVAARAQRAARVRSQRALASNGAAVLGSDQIEERVPGQRLNEIRGGGERDVRRNARRARIEIGRIAGSDGIVENRGASWIGGGCPVERDAVRQKKILDLRWRTPDRPIGIVAVASVGDEAHGRAAGFN